MKWVARKNIKVDSVACHWLIRRLIDPQAAFLCVAEDQLLQTARREGATPFDAPRIAEVKLNHRSFEAIIEDFALSDPASIGWPDCSCCGCERPGTRCAGRIRVE